MDARSHGGVTPLIAAAEGTHGEVIKLLLQVKTTEGQVVTSGGQVKTTEEASGDEWRSRRVVGRSWCGAMSSLVQLTPGEVPRGRVMTWQSVKVRGGKPSKIRFDPIRFSDVLFGSPMPPCHLPPATCHMPPVTTACQLSHPSLLPPSPTPLIHLPSPSLLVLFSPAGWR